jgi:hypothetical protein
MKLVKPFYSNYLSNINEQLYSDLFQYNLYFDDTKSSSFGFREYR